MKLRLLPVFVLVALAGSAGGYYLHAQLSGGAELGAMAEAHPAPGAAPADRSDAGGTAAPAGAPAAVPDLRALSNAFIEIAQSVNPTVVTVTTEKTYRVAQGTAGSPYFGSPFGGMFGQFFGYSPGYRQPPQEREYRQQGLGSGVLISSDGYVLTNNHVVQEADSISVRLMDDRVLSAKVVGTDPKTDIAVLKVEGENLPAITLGDSDDLRVGEWVLAVGSPLSPNLAHTVTSGIVSAKGRSNVGLAEYEDFIQTDAAINPGNSGGALISLDGRLVGINTAIATRSGGFQGIGFAVPINMARRVMESLIERGTVVRGYLGVQIQDIDEALAEAMKLPSTEGALVAEVTGDGPAEQAGLEQGDFITELDGEPVRNTVHLRNEVASRAPGSEIELKLLRDGGEKTIRAELGSLPGDQISPETADRLEKLFGFRVAPFDREMAEHYHLDSTLKGVIITSIDPASPAYRAGMNEGDLIVALDRTPLESMEQFNDLIQGLEQGETVFFRLVRRNQSFFAAFRL